MGELTRESTRANRAKLRTARDVLTSADYDLAVAARYLREAPELAWAAEADSLFRAALTLRQKIEAELDRRDA